MIKLNFLRISAYCRVYLLSIYVKLFAVLLIDSSNGKFIVKIVQIKLNLLRNTMKF